MKVIKMAHVFNEVTCFLDIFYGPGSGHGGHDRYNIYFHDTCRKLVNCHTVSIETGHYGRAELENPTETVKPMVASEGQLRLV